MKKLIRTKKAITPVFTTVLLILLVVAGMTIVFAFLVSYVEDYQSGQGAAILENYAIEDVWFKDSNQIEITIFNYGKIELNIKSIFINGLTIGFSVENHDNFELPAGQHRTAITNPTTFTPNTPYQFKIVTQRGSTFESTFISPEAST